ncbi:hypothetical protein PVAND_008866 [Polypedilum vanderplanki]|uniref:Chitin-binding type-2 domain-containing protein n=1 Tax=Polypedilum vanderplanki TaxID=319348 RepID=A0A9J6CBB0_POLVA|nr:hypothetical protein PVAND_008866 [Polypedilum vanderplanki]
MKVLINALCVAFFFTLAAAVDSKNETKIIDPFENDDDLRFAADTFCREYTLSNPLGRTIALPYKPNCHFWWQCTTYQLEKKECQGLNHKITLHYDLYLNRCEMPSTVKCLYQYDEEEIIMEAIMEYYKKDEKKEK